ncbi:MAG: [LysW]-lysine hydrolase [Chloroflexota bacterium]|nr:[LysW]-lysine hydrolase [Chloroflexota bacterium]
MSHSPRDLASLAAVHASRDDVELLHGLVAIESLSGGEGEAVTYLCDAMAQRGFRVERDRVGNAIGSVGCGERHIVLLGHIDTVPGHIPVRIKDDVLHGRGAVDAKGPLATFIAAATIVADRAKVKITVVGAVGEETLGSPGAVAVAAWPAPDWCVIGEPSGWDALCLGYRGTLSLSYRLEQDSRHTAGPGQAVGERAIAYWNAVAAEAARRNVGVVGEFASLGVSLRAFNTSGDGLAERAELSIGLRLPPNLDVAGLIATLRECTGEADVRIEGCQEGYRTEKRSPLTAPFLREIRRNGGTPRFTLKLGTSDMTVVGPRWGCPIVAYGPGDASLDHTPQERVSLDDYGRAIEILSGVLLAL